MRRFIVCAIILLALTSCLPAAESSAVLTTEVDLSGQPLNQATDFSVDTPRILLSVRMAGMPAATALRAEWLYLDGNTWQAVEGEAFSAGSPVYAVMGISSPPAGWRPGRYSVKLYHNDREANRLDFTVRPVTTTALPQVNNFSLTPSSITAGQPATLSWNVSGATRVIIEPAIGTVPAGGSRQVSPSADTTYTLTALNSGGSSGSTVTLRVLPAPAGQADLVVLELFRESVMVYYTVQNQGPAASQPCHAQLYVGSNMLGSDYLPALAPGEKRTEVFGQYSWSYPDSTTATACVDTDSLNVESNEVNNCLTRTLAGVRVF